MLTETFQLGTVEKKIIKYKIGTMNVTNKKKLQRIKVKIMIMEVMLKKGGKKRHQRARKKKKKKR